MKIIQSTCNYCSLACNMDFYVEDNQIIKVIPTKKYPVNKGFSCIKGLSLGKQGTSREFPRYPILRDSGMEKSISWDEASGVFANKIGEIVEKYGKESVAAISTGQITLEDMALLGHVWRNYVGGELDGNTRLCMATSVVAHKQSFGFDAPPYTLDDLELSDVIVFIGANPVVAHPIVWDRVRKNKGAKVIVIDPRRTETAKGASMHIELKPKSDIVLMYTLANELIKRGWIDSEYIKNYSIDYEGFKEHIGGYNLDRLEEVTGVSIEQAEQLLELIHKGKAVSFWWTMGINQGYQGVRTAQSIINLAVITGNIGREGTGANSLTGQCNAMGSRLFSNTTGLYGAGDYGDEALRTKVGKAIGIDPSLFPTKPTLPYNVIIEKIISGEIKALWIVATNPRHSWINNDEFIKAIKKLEFFVVQDIYDDTHTSKLADLFLPVVPSIKKEGTLINTERRISKVNYVLEKEEGEKNDSDVFLSLGKALGMSDLLDGWDTPEKVFNKMKRTTKGSPCDMSGVSYKLLEEGYGVQWPFRDGDSLEKLGHERRLFEDNQYYTPSGRVKLIYEDVMDNPMPINSRYPYILNTGRGSVGQWHTETRSREIVRVEDAVSKKAYIYISNILARELGIEERQEVVIESINGRESTFLAMPTKDLPREQLYAPIHYIETNRLTISVYDTYSKEPSYKYAPVNIKRP